jgi:DNA end-binding protein Ku
MLDLAVHIVNTKKGKFEPEKFEDQYEDALKEIIRKKQKGEKIERPKQPAHGKVVNLMDALRQSVEASDERKKSAAHHRREPKRASQKGELIVARTSERYGHYSPVPQMQASGHLTR